MYRALSPIFDVPEFPPLRRVKPLPKRRRTSDSLTLDDAGNPVATAPTLLDPDATPDELIARTDALTAQLALQSYYMPILGGVQDLFKGDLASGTATPIDLGGAYGPHDGDDGDYTDHLQQPGNTKKRKVPANTSGSAHGPDGGSASGSGAEDEPAERGIPSGARADRDYDAPVPAAPAQRRGRLARATLAGLQHKEMLRARKRQLAAVLGALSHGDTLALDQALSASYPFVDGGGGDGDGGTARVRLSRRRGPRLARALRAFRAAHPSEAAAGLPPAEFSFVCHSATADRLVATKEEVAVLHGRFEAELARQAAKAAEAAKLAAAAGPGGPHAKRGTPGVRAPGVRGGEPSAASLEQSLLGAKAGGKKKKRAALANASNPHHLRNYVPSRLPNTGANAQAAAGANAQNLLGPLPLRFLSAEMPPRRRKKTESVPTPVSTLTNPAEEWVCPFCEYGLFYGDEVGFQRAVRNRKKILRRRRRARERAAAAASGVGSAMASGKDTPVRDEVGGGVDAVAGEAAGSGGVRQTRWKDEKEHGGHGGPG